MLWSASLPAVMKYLEPLDLTKPLTSNSASRFFRRLMQKVGRNQGQSSQNMCCACPPWRLYCTFITRYDGFRPALKGGRNDGAVSMWKNVLWIVVDIFPAVGTSLQEESRDGKQDHTQVHSVNTNSPDCRQTLLDHADSLIPFLAALESLLLCGRQMISVNVRGN